MVAKYADDFEFESLTEVGEAFIRRISRIFLRVLFHIPSCALREGFQSQAKHYFSEKADQPEATTRTTGRPF